MKRPAALRMTRDGIEVCQLEPAAGQARDLELMAMTYSEGNGSVVRRG